MPIELRQGQDKPDFSCQLTDSDSVLSYLIDELLPDIKSLAELKITLFIIKNIYDSGRNFACITLNQFMKGIQDKNSRFINRGVGLARQHIIKGISLAEEHGTILVYRQGHKGKEKRWYFLNTPENQKIVQALAKNDLSINSLIANQQVLEEHII